MPAYTAHLDTFARDNLPPRELWPDFSFDLPELRYPERLNCATELLDRTVERGLGDKTVFHTPNERWTYGELLERANRIARVLSDDLGLVPGNRVLLRAANNPMLVACWFAVLKAGGIAVTTMPLLRARELAVILEKAQIRLALCDERLAEELEQARSRAPVCERICYFNGSGQPGAGAELEERMRHATPEFDNVDTASDDVALIAFTSGTTGQPKGTMHFHRDVMAICDCFPRSTLEARRGRRVHRQPADRLHLRPRRRGHLPDALWRVRRAARGGAARRPAPGDRGVPGDRLLHLADRLSDDAGQGGRARPLQPDEVRLGRRAPAAADLRGVAAATGLAHHRRHRRDRDAAHLHLRRGRRHPAGRDRTAAPGLPARWSWTTTCARCRPARSAGSPCAGRPAAAISPTSGRRSTCATAGTSRATPTRSTRTAISGSRRAPTT